LPWASSPAGGMFFRLAGYLMDVIESLAAGLAPLGPLFFCGP